jgi:hypothetical protein
MYTNNTRTQLPINNRWEVLNEDRESRIQTTKYRPPNKNKPTTTLTLNDFPSLNMTHSSDLPPPLKKMKMTDLFLETNQTENPTNSHLGVVFTMDKDTHKIIRNPPFNQPKEETSWQTKGENLIRIISNNQDAFRQSYDENNMHGYGYDSVFYPSPVDSDEESYDENDEEDDYYDY